jgi:hypothetical protein
MRVSLGPSCIVRPSFTRPGGTKSDTRVAEALVPKNSARREAHHTCTERLLLQRLKRWAEDVLELTCLWTACVGKLSLVALALADRGILHPLRVSTYMKGKKKQSYMCVPSFL